VVEKLGLREEGVARGFLQIDGVFEDHVRYGLTAEEWDERGADIITKFLT
jgi:ribosomal-protein-alanine N-acetyltransferase